MARPSFWTHSINRPKLWKGPYKQDDWEVAQEKLDGFRLIGFHAPVPRTHPPIVFGRDFRPHLEYTARYPSLKDTDWYRVLASSPPFTSFDAEVIVPGGSSKDVVTALKAGRGYKIITFGIPYYNGEDLRDTRISKLDRLADKLGLCPVRSYTREQLVEQLDLPPHTQITQSHLLELANALRTEGFVLKSTQGGKWYKVKAADPVDCIITDVKSGEGKYSHLIGALEVSVHSRSDLKAIAWVSGMTDSEREEMTRLHSRRKLLGRVCEVAHQPPFNGNRLRHPRFVRWRPDKPSEECTIDQ